MTVTHKLSAQLHDGMVGIDPLTIIAILSALIQAFMNCNKTAAEAAEIIKKPKAFQWLKCKRIIREKLFEAGNDTGDVDELYASFRKHYKSINEEMVGAMYDEYRASLLTTAK